MREAGTGQPTTVLISHPDKKIERVRPLIPGVTLAFAPQSGMTLQRMLPSFVMCRRLPSVGIEEQPGSEVFMSSCSFYAVVSLAGRLSLSATYSEPGHNDSWDDAVDQDRFLTLLGHSRWQVW